MSPILSFLRRLFSREEAPEPGSLAAELWAAELEGPERGRFEELSGPGYDAAYREGGLELGLSREGLFAWSEAGLYRYADFALEALLELPAEGYGAAGLLFRYADEGNFYSLLVSNRGRFRLDALFNGKPRPLIAWTELPAREAAPAGPCSLRLLARGDRILIALDGAWAGEVEDDTHRSGKLAFAAQRYAPGAEPSPPLPAPAAQAGRLAFRLDALLLESRPLEVEALYQGLAHLGRPEAGARRRLAETFLAMGLFLPALVQLRKIERARPLEAGELFLRAEAALRLELYEDAEEALGACLALEPGRPEALAERANLLYLRGRYLELREAAGELAAREPGNPRAETLLGHARFNLGDYRGAAEAYARAAEAAPGQPLLRMNEARSWDQAGQREAAVEAYLRAAEGFYEAEAEDDLALALGRLEALGAPEQRVKALRARALFRAGRKAEAGGLIEGLLASGSRDAGLHYLAGLLEAEGGRRERALERFEVAFSLEPGEPLYAFRRAESLYLLGRPEAREAAEAALAAWPAEGWMANLGGLLLLGELSAEAGRGLPLDPEKAALARARFEAARAALPEAAEPSMNLAELEGLEGRLEEALARLSAFPERAEARNQAGNLLVAAARASQAAPCPGPASGPGPEAAEEGRTDAEAAESGRALEAEALFERALREYEAATRLEPGRADFQENLAALLLELERFADAELALRRALDSGGGPRAYLLAGNLALAYGERPRAEAAYRLGLELAPEDPGLLLALGRVRVSSRAWAKAEESLSRLEALDPERAARLRGEILEARTEGIACAACGRGWRVPRELPAQSGESIRAMPPDDSPAGSCPSCGRTFCIACRKGELRESRFTCPDCGDFLKLSDQRLRWLVRESLRREASRA